MNFLKKLFGVSTETPQTPEEKEAEDRKNFDILKYDGVRAMKMHRYDYAVECFRHALQLKDDLEIHDYQYQVYMALGDLAKAYGELEKLAEAQPDNIDIFLRMAHVAYMMEDYVVMGSACEKALLIDKDSPLGLYLYAKACIGTDDVTNAVAMLTRAILVKPDYADAYLLRGEVLLKDGKTDEAYEDVKQLLKGFSGNEDVLMLKANVEMARGDVLETMKSLDRVIASNPFRADAYKLRGELRKRHGDEAGAKEDLLYAAELEEQQSAGQQEDIEEKTKEQYAQTGLV